MYGYSGILTLHQSIRTFAHTHEQSQYEHQFNKEMIVAMVTLAG